MKKLVIATLLIVTINAWAGFGGSRGGGGSFSGGRSSFSNGSRSSFSGGGFRSSGSSSFGGSRGSMGRPVTITRPSAPALSTSTHSTHTTVIERGGSSGPGFFSGLLMGNILSHPAPVVVAPGVGGYAGEVAPVVVQQGPSFLGVLLSILGVVALIFFLVVIFK